MTLIVPCTTCGRELRSQDRYAGLSVRCPQCGTINALPSEPVELPQTAICFLCGRDFTADPDLVKDTGGRYYHRQCYEGASRYEQARRAEEARRRQTGEFARPPENTSRAEILPPVVDGERFGELELTVDDLWKDLLAPSSVAQMPWEPSSTLRRDTAWLYVLMGFAAAVPVVVLMFIAMQLFLTSLEPRSPQRSLPVSPPSASAVRPTVSPVDPKGEPAKAP